MNEKQLIKKINKTHNYQGNLTYAIIAQLLDEQDNSLYAASFKDKIFAKLRLTKNIKTVPQIIEDNFEFILEKTSDATLKNLISLLLEDSEPTKEVVLRNIDKVLKRLEYKEERYRAMFDISRTQAEISLDFNKRWIFRNILKSPEGKETIKKNIDLILATTYPSNLFENLQLLKGLSQKTDKKLNEYMATHKETLTRSMAIKNVRNRYEII